MILLYVAQVKSTRLLGVTVFDLQEVYVRMFEFIRAVKQQQRDRGK